MSLSSVDSAFFLGGELLEETCESGRLRGWLENVAEREFGVSEKAACVLGRGRTGSAPKICDQKWIVQLLVPMT